MDPNEPFQATISKQFKQLQGCKPDDFIKRFYQNVKKFRGSYILFMMSYSRFNDIFSSLNQQDKGKFVDVVLKFSIQSSTSMKHEWPCLLTTPNLVNQLKKLSKERQNLQIHVKVEPRENETKVQQLISLFYAKVIKVLNNEGNNQQDFKKAIEGGFQINHNMLNNDYNFQAFDMFAANFLNDCLQRIRKKKQDKTICCKTIFLQKEFLQASEGPNQQFKRYTWPISNSSIKNHLTKTIIGFMNSKGGIIYIGIMQNKDKKNEVVGISLKNTQVRPLQVLICQLVNLIYPKHEGFGYQNSDKKQQQTNQKLQIFLQINDYVKMEFLPVVDPTTYTNSTPEGIPKYVVKIIVKKGHPKHLYHQINNQKSIDFFERMDRNVEKKQFPDAYKEIYNRLQKFQKFKEDYRKYQPQKKGMTQKEKEEQKFKAQKQRDLFHPHCRYSMYIKTYILKEDRNSDDDDSDDDDDE